MQFVSVQWLFVVVVVVEPATLSCCYSCSPAIRGRLSASKERPSSTSTASASPVVAILLLLCCCCWRERLLCAQQAVKQAGSSVCETVGRACAVVGCCCSASLRCRLQRVESVSVRQSEFAAVSLSTTATHRLAGRTEGLVSCELLARWLLAEESDRQS